MTTLINRAVDATQQTTMALMWLLSALSTLMSGYFLLVNYWMNEAAFRSLPVQHIGGDWEYRFGGALPIVAQVLTSFWWWNGDRSGKQYDVAYLALASIFFTVDSAVTIWYLTAGDITASWYSTSVAIILTIVVYGIFCEYFFSWSLSYCIVAMPNMIESVGYTANLVNKGLVNAAKHLQQSGQVDDDEPSPRVAAAVQRASEQIGQRSQNLR